MGFLDRLKRNRGAIDPDKISEYDPAQKRRLGVAWMLGAATLIATVLVTMALFYGVRFAYREITGDDETTQTTSQDQDGQEQATPAQEDSNDKPKKPRSSSNGNTAPRTGDSLPASGDTLPATGDPGM
jgi:hypothetical protein